MPWHPVTYAHRRSPSQCMKNSHAGFKVRIPCTPANLGPVPDYTLGVAWVQDLITGGLRDLLSHYCNKCVIHPISVKTKLNPETCAYKRVRANIQRPTKARPVLHMKYQPTLVDKLKANHSRGIAPVWDRCCTRSRRPRHGWVWGCASGMP